MKLKKNSSIIIFLLILLTTTCQLQPEENNINITGLWRGVLQSPGGELPFGIEIQKHNDELIAKIINGSERVDTSSVEVSGKEITINFTWFDARIKATIINSNKMKGIWSKTTSGKDKTSQLSFIASKTYSYRFLQKTRNPTTTSVDGKWKVVFNDDNEDIAIAEFHQNGENVNGTFLTPTGDYRFLAGDASNGKLRLSAFDGAHAFLFKADIAGNKIINGHFWSRDSYHATWKAIKAKNVSNYLPSSWEMNKTTDKVKFSFEDISGKVIKLTDDGFNNKPVLVNLFGTWCPNCNDEAPVLAKFYDKYNKQGLEIVGLAFEFTQDPERDKKQLATFKERHGINYPLLLAGGNDKIHATKVLGFLDKVKSYPTTIFLDKNHEVVKIHTGFSGPGTGSHYKNLVKELETEIIKLLK